MTIAMLPSCHVLHSGIRALSRACSFLGRGALFAGAMVLANPAAGAVYTVTNINDSGAGSLRQALLDLQAGCGAGGHSIAFNIPGAGPHVIQPLTELGHDCPNTTIDGYTQTDATANTLPLGGNNADIRIELDGSLAAAGTRGLVLYANTEDSKVRGLAITRFPAQGFHAVGYAGNGTGSIEFRGNYVGMSPDGTIHPNLGAYAVHFETSGYNQIGGANPADANIIIGGSDTSLFLNGANFNTVAGNHIGADRSGAAVPSGNRALRGIAAHYNGIIGADSNAFGIAGGPGNLVVAGNYGIEYGPTCQTDTVSRSVVIGTAIAAINRSGNVGCMGNPELQTVIITPTAIRFQGQAWFVNTGNYRVELFQNAAPAAAGQLGQFVAEQTVAIAAGGPGPFDITFNETNLTHPTFTLTDLTASITSGTARGTAAYWAHNVTPGLSFSANPAAFSIVPGGTQTQTITITNNDAGATDPMTPVVTGTGFSVQSTTCPASLAVGASCDVVLAFTLPGVGSSTGLLSVDLVPASAGYVTTKFQFPLSGDSLVSYALSVAKIGTGTGTIASGESPTPVIDCGSTCSASLASGTSVTLTASAAAGSSFAFWTGDCSGSSPVCVVTMSAARNVSAAFVQGSIASPTLGVALAGSGTGTVNSSVVSPAISCPGTCTAGYASGTSVTLTAAPTGGHVFAGWGGACSGTAATCTVTVSSVVDVTATFNLPASVALTSSDADNATVYSEPFILTATVSGGRNPGGKVLFKANGAAMNGNCATGGASLAGGRALHAVANLAASASAWNLTAEYCGDADNAAATSSNLAHTVGKATTALVVTSATANPSAVGQPVTYDVALTVAGPATDAPDGTVVVTAGAQSCTAPVDSGVGNCSIIHAAVGSPVNVTGAFAATANHLGASSSVLARTVVRGSQSLAFTVPASLVAGSGTLTLGATATSGLAVSYSLSATPPGACTLAAGVLTPASAGTCTVTANQAGDANWDPAPAVARTLTVTAGAGPTSLPSATGLGGTTTVSLGDGVTLYATVTGAAGTPSGTVTFSSGASTLCNAVAIDGAGVASCTFTPAATGTFVVTASYGGSATYGASSATLSVLVGAAVGQGHIAVDFGIQAVNRTSSPRSVIFTNASGVTLTSIVVSASGDFAQTSDCAAPMATGASCVIAATFRPAAAGTRSGSLSIATSAGNQGIGLAGVGVAAPGLSASVSTLTFPLTVSRTSSATKVVTLVNDGSASTTVAGVAVTGPFVIEGNDCLKVLTVGATCAVRVYFKPETVGDLSGQLLVTSDAVPSLLAVGLSGSAAPDTSALYIRLFGTVPAGVPVGAPYATPVQVRVTDRHGTPVAGIAVRWRAPMLVFMAGQQVFPIALEGNQSNTDANGIASMRILPPIVGGDWSVVADVPGATIESAVIRLLALDHGPAKAIVIAGGDGQVGFVNDLSLGLVNEFRDPLEVKVVDAWGNGVRGARVSFLVIHGPGLVGAALGGANVSVASAARERWLVEADREGRAAIRAAAGSLPGEIVIEAEVFDVEDKARFVLRAVTDGPKLVVVAGLPQVGAVGTALRDPVQLRLTDASGTPLARERVTVQLVAQSPLDCCSPAAAARWMGRFDTSLARLDIEPHAPHPTYGVLAVDAALDAAGAIILPPIIAGAEPGLWGMRVTGPAFPETLVAGPFATVATAPSSMVVEQGHGTSANPQQPFPAIKVRILDAAGQPVNLAFTRFEADLDPQRVGLEMLGDLESRQLDRPFGGDSSSNAFVVAYPTVGGRVGVLPTAGNLAGPTQVRISVPGSHLSAVVGLTVTGQTPSQIGCAIADRNVNTLEHRVGTALPASLRVRYTDQLGNPVAGRRLLLQATNITSGSANLGPGATLTASEATTDANGMVRFEGTSSIRPGSFQVVARDPERNVKGLCNVRNEPGTAARLKRLSQKGTESNPIYIQVGQVLTDLGVHVADQYGNSVERVRVTFTAPTGGPSAIFAGQSTTVTVLSNPTDAPQGGEASTGAVANGTPGSYQVLASAPGVAEAVIFHVSNLGPPTSMVIAGGNNQVVPQNSRFPQLLRVDVLDAAGQRTNAPVTIAIPSDSVAIFRNGQPLQPSNPVLQSGPGGIALEVRSGSSVGTFPITFSIPGGLSVTFNLTVATSVPAVTATGNTTVTVPADTSVGTPVTMLVKNAAGLPVAGALVNFSFVFTRSPCISPRVPTATPPSQLTNERGLASAIIKANGCSIPFTVRATTLLPAGVAAMVEGAPVSLGAASAGAMAMGAVQAKGPEDGLYVVEFDFVPVDVPDPALDPAGDADGDGIPNGLEYAQGTYVLDKDNDVFGSARLFAMQQYRDFLGRESDDAGAGYWESAIASGAVNRADGIRAFLDSPEFGQRVAPVVRLYFAYLNRIPDYEGLSFWVDEFGNGRSLEDISQAFAGSPEFLARYGQLSNAEFVARVYASVLGRAPDAPGLAHWVGQLDSGALTRGSLMIAFSESAEYAGLIGSDVFVTMLYYGMLRRSPDEEGFHYWANRIDADGDARALIDAFLGSPEYHDRFLPSSINGGV